MKGDTRGLEQRGLDVFRKRFSPKSAFIVGDGGISAEDFLSMDITNLVQVRIGLSYRPHRPCIARPPDRQQHFHVIFRKHTKHVVLCIFSLFSWSFKKKSSKFAENM